MPDVYPIVPYHVINDYQINWNSETVPTGHIFFQDYIEDKLLKQYKHCKQYCLEDNSRKYYPVVQAAGKWTDSQCWEDWMLPPYETQKALQFLPLCYGADGIFNFILQDNLTPVMGISTNPSGFYCSLIRPSSSAPIETTYTFNALQEANAKIHVYCSYLKTKQFEWIDADSLKVESPQTTLNLQSVGIDSLYVLNPHNGSYKGYVQCGLYTNPYNIPALMLMNRRANYFSAVNYSNPKDVHPDEMATHFPAFSSQTVHAVINPSVYQQRWSYPAFFDPFDSTLYIPSDNGINVPLAAGDGKLLRMVGTLPPVVTDNSEIRGTGYLQGDIEIGNGSTVTRDSTSTLTLLPHTHLVVNSGSTLTLKGQIVCCDSSYIKVNHGCTLDITEADFTMGRGCYIEVECGTLNISGSSFQKSDSTQCWTGIIALGEAEVNISNSVIKDALVALNTHDSNLSLTDNKIYLPNLSGHGQIYGVTVNNIDSGSIIQITGTDPEYGFYGSNSLNTTGIKLMGVNDSLSVSGLTYHNLFYGMEIVDTFSEQQFRYQLRAFQFRHDSLDRILLVSRQGLRQFPKLFHSQTLYLQNHLAHGPESPFQPFNAAY